MRRGAARSTRRKLTQPRNDRLLPRALRQPFLGVLALADVARHRNQYRALRGGMDDPVDLDREGKG